MGGGTVISHYSGDWTLVNKQSHACGVWTTWGVHLSPREPHYLLEKFSHGNPTTIGYDITMTVFKHLDYWH